ncbi:hypothetical protein CHUAL_013286 [Chamberlinius hualienensis]
MTFIKVPTVALVYILYFCCTVNSHEKYRTNGQEKRILKMIFMWFRHGARAPVQELPNQSWNGIGLGELTNFGKRQQLQNGVTFRNNKDYDKFIGLYYNFTEFYIQSSTINRAIMSGEAFTTGLFPPNGNQIWTNESCLGYNWQPIPVFTLFDINNPYDPNGDRIANLMLQAQNDPYIKNRNKEIIDAVSNVTGAPLNLMFLYIDALICEVYEKNTLPSGLEKYKDKLFSFADDVFNYMIERYYPFTASGLLNDMVKRIELYNNKSSTVKTFIYSLHDLHVAAFMRAIGVLVGEPEFCGAAYLELYEPDETSKTDYVIVRYRRTLDSEIKQAYIDQCGHTCPYGKFLELVKRVNNSIVDFINQFPI